MPVGNERIEVSYILSGHVVTELYLLAFINQEVLTLKAAKIVPKQIYCIKGGS